MKTITTIYVLAMFTLINLAAQDELTLLATIHGENEGDGYSKVETLGDVNGDGFDEFIVGSNRSGYAKLYFGGSPFDTNNYIRFESSASFTAYKGSFAGRGDLNGDGYTDFVLGAAYDIFQFGKVFVHFGGVEIDTTADLTITGQGYYYQFGSSISIEGDLNGDGYDDLVVSAPMDDYDARGRVYIYFGGEEMDSECDVYLEGKEPFDSFGGTLSVIGDVNGDGYDDLLVGAPQTLAENKPGKAYLFFGGDEIGFENSLEFIGDENTYDYGMFLSGLGDINGDGFNDFGITSFEYVDIFLGSQTMDDINSVCQFSGEFSFIGTLRDINKDNYSDYVIVQRDIGIHYGEEEIDAVSDITLNFWANPVVNLGDINGDNKDEIAFGIGGGWDPNGRVEIYTYTGLSSAEDGNEKFPIAFQLNNNYPNPFNSQTRISYTITEGSKVEVTIYDITGKIIKNLLTGYQPSGSYEIKWDGLDEDNSLVSSGVYFLRLSAKSFSDNSQLQQKIIKMVLMK